MDTLAKDIMSTEIMSVREGTPVEDALKILVNSRITGLPVVDAQGKMVGICSDYDIITQLSSHETMSPAVFREPVHFSAKIQTVTEKTRLNEIVQLFVESRYRRLPVISREGKLVGIITRRDLMKLFYYRSALS